MTVTSRPAEIEDIDVLVRLYRDLEQEQTALRSMWRLADGLPEPAPTAFKEIFDDHDSLLIIGELEAVALGFVWVRIEGLLPQAEGSEVGVIRFIHTDLEARGVGIGAAMMSLTLNHLRERGISRFDARVSPGHRNAKNFFEAHGFKARLIVMHHDDKA